MSRKPESLVGEPIGEMTLEMWEDVCRRIWQRQRPTPPPACPHGIWLVQAFKCPLCRLARRDGK